MRVLLPITLFLSLVVLAGCGVLDVGLGPRVRNDGSWPLAIFTAGDGQAAVSTVTRPVQFYFVCQTREQPRPDESGPAARWKVNFYTFVQQEMDYFDSATTTITGGFNLQFDEVGGWFLVVPVMDEIAGDYGITRRGVIYMRRDLVLAKLGKGIIRCKYKYPNLNGISGKDQFDSSDMTLMAASLPGTDPIEIARQAPIR